jgi:tetratricopeptide (TPR) repeat protein
MALAFRIRVIWDDTVIEDHVHDGGSLLIGAGPHANVVAPGKTGHYVSFTRKGKGFEIVIPPGAARTVEFPGEEPVDLSQATEAFVRQLDPPFGSGRLHIGNAVIEFERAELLREQRDRLIYAWAAAAAVLAMMAGGSYRLVRLFGDGDKPQWGNPPSLSDRDASRMRVRIGPEGMGASRPQAGRGFALKGSSDAAKLAMQTERPDKKPAKKPKAARPKAVPTAGIVVAKAQDGQLKGKDPDGVVEAVTAKPTKEKSRSEVIEDAQSALLAADLRRAIDSFSHAAQKGPLEYDQLNWLGLAHYLSGEYQQAEEVWGQARDIDGARADAVNNLASVAKRRGDGDTELKYLQAALAIAPEDCHASNSLALAQAKYGKGDALATLAKSDASCGGNYAYTAIQKAGILALRGDIDKGLEELEKGLQRVDTLIPIKEFEVLTDLRLDPAFAKLRANPKFASLVTKYLPRAATWKDVPGLNGSDDKDL